MKNRKVNILVAMISLITGCLIGLVLVGKAFGSEEEIFSFPNCPLDYPGDKAHYDTGLHQIYYGGLKEGSDDVYSLGDGNFLQCFCGLDNQGIQTNWLRDEEGNVNGLQWNLGDYQYFVSNHFYDCGEEEVLPSPTPTQVPQQSQPSVSEPSGGSHGENVCNGIYAKNPAVGTGVRLDEDSVELQWTPSTDSHDRQTIVYGSSPDALDYSVLDVPANVGSWVINDITWDTHTFYQIDTWNGECISHSPIFDP